jgi:predicted TIM-barrel fold metal-dependent hydrolase
MIDYPLVDADSHYYETPDCFTRHLEARFRDRAVLHVPGKDGIGRVYQGERRLPFASTWPIDYMAPPGALIDYFLGKKERSAISEAAEDPKEHPEFYRKAERLALMDRERVQAAILLPTLAVQVENDIRGDVPALYANVRAFNRWLEEEWGFGADRRVFGVTMLSLVDPELAADELERVAAAGARLIYLRPGPLHGRSPADRAYDRFWSTLNDAEIPVIFHIGDCNAVYAELYASAWGENPHPHLHQMNAFQQYACNGDRPIMDTYAALIFHNLFGRFPKVRAMSIELGCTWVSWFLKSIDKAQRDAFGQDSGYGKLSERPSEIFKRHVFIAPFYEEDAVGLARTIGADHVLFGSDFPHPEGVAHPIQFADRLDGLGPDDVKRIMRTNTAELLKLAV